MGSSFSQPQQDISRLLKAAEAGSKKDVLRLVACNPLLAATASAKSGRTLWHAAAQHGQPDLIAAVAAHIQLLWDGQLRQGIAWTEDISVSPVQSVPESNHVLAYLVNMKDKKGRTPLVWACIRGSVQSVEVLLSLGANPRVALPNGKMPLHYAAQHGHTRQVLQLLQWWQHQQQNAVESNSAFLDAETAHGITPLHLAVLRCHPATVKVLVEHGASVTKTCTYPHKGPRWLTHKYDGCTALHLAAATGSKSITCLLLAAHFQGGRADEQDPRALRNYQGRLAVDIALGRGYRRVAEVLEPTAPLSMFMSRRELGLTPIPKLAQLAGQALQQKLLLELQSVETKLKDTSKEKEADDDAPLPILDDSIKQDLISTIRKSLSLESNVFRAAMASLDHDELSARLIPEDHPTSATIPCGTVLFNMSPPNSGHMDASASPSPSASSPTAATTAAAAAGLSAAAAVECRYELADLIPASGVSELRAQDLGSTRASRTGKTSMRISLTPSQASVFNVHVPDLLHNNSMLANRTSGDMPFGSAIRRSGPVGDIPYSSAVRTSGSSGDWAFNTSGRISSIAADAPLSATNSHFTTSYSASCYAATGSHFTASLSATGSHQAASHPATDASHMSGPPHTSNSDEEANLDLDEDPICCETAKAQTDPAAPSTASLLSSASHLIGGTLRKALGGGHHRSRSANGSQGGNGPLSIIASMAPLLPESSSAGTGTASSGSRPMNSPEGWAASCLADWAASTSTYGTVPAAHAALLAIQVDDEEDDVCEVCMDRPQEVTVLSCQHKMCVECCRSVLKMRDMAAPLCPFCRGQIEGLQ